MIVFYLISTESHKKMFYFQIIIEEGLLIVCWSAREWEFKNSAIQNARFLLRSYWFARTAIQSIRLMSMVWWPYLEVIRSLKWMNSWMRDLFSDYAQLCGTESVRYPHMHNPFWLPHLTVTYFKCSFYLFCRSLNKINLCVLHKTTLRKRLWMMMSQLTAKDLKVASAFTELDDFSAKLPPYHPDLPTIKR